MNQQPKQHKQSADKCVLYASLAELLRPEESKFGLPPEEERMEDLQYIYGILVSSGMNLNGAVFLPSELIAARDTMLGKALDVEHIEYASVGYIYDRAFMTKEGDIFDPLNFLAERGNKVDKEKCDIAILAKLWKYRYSDVAEDVADGKYKLSMECYYEDFDIMVGDVIISQAEAEKAGIPVKDIKKLSGRAFRVIMPNGEIRQATLGRVLRGITFAGCGLVEDPANPESVIKDVASNQDSAGRFDDLVIDLSDISSGETMQKNSSDLQKDFTKPADSITNRTGALDNSSAESARSENPGTCVSFKRYVYAYQPPQTDLPSPEGEEQVQLPNIPGVGDDPGPDDKIVAERWCALFDTKCTTLGGDATDARCLRNILATTTSEVISDMDELHTKLFWADYEMITNRGYEQELQEVEDLKIDN